MGFHNIPEWLTVLAWVSLALGGICALIITADIIGNNRQHMRIMNVVWPVTALYSGLLGLWAYWKVGRLSSRRATERAKKRGEPPPAMRKPFWQSAGVAATHCGSGCTLGDILAEGVILSLIPVTLFGHQLFAGWVVDFLVAFLFGIAFQYFTIKPMQHLPPGQGLLAALKADTLSLMAWQIGMYGWMAIVTFWLFGHELRKGNPVFWFMMQIGMLAGFLTSYPINWWLVRRHIKEKM